MNGRCNGRLKSQVPMSYDQGVESFQQNGHTWLETINSEDDGANLPDKKDVYFFVRLCST